MKDSSYCYVHNDAVDEIEKKANRSKGGKSNKHICTVALKDIPINSPTDIPVLLIDTISLIRAGKLETRIGTCIGYLANVLVRAYELYDIAQRMDTIELKLNNNVQQ